MGEEGTMKDRACRRCGGTGREAVDPVPELRAARKASGLSYAKLAQRLGVSAPYLREVEKGSRSITPMRVAAWLGACSIDDGA